MFNIEKSASKPGEYVGYANDGLYRIRKTNMGWFAQGRESGKIVQRDTLRQMSETLENIEDIK